MDKDTKQALRAAWWLLVAPAMFHAKADALLREIPTAKPRPANAPPKQPMSPWIKIGITALLVAAVVEFVYALARIDLI